MEDYSDIIKRLPTKQKALLSNAIGRCLLDIRRLFWIAPSTFTEDGRFTATEFFAYNNGPTQPVFNEGITHTLNVYGEQLSIVVSQNPLEDIDEAHVYSLLETEYASPDLKMVLGKVCRDIRVWTLREEFQSDEAKEAAISYLFDDGSELFYCIYLHGNLDADYLLLGHDVPRDQVASCFSIAKGELVQDG